MKATVLGDNGDLEEEGGYDPFRRTGGRVSLGGAAGRAPRGVVRAVATAGIAASGLGGPAPVRPVYGGGADGGGGIRPVEREAQVER